MIHQNLVGIKEGFFPASLFLSIDEYQNRIFDSTFIKNSNSDL